MTELQPAENLYDYPHYYDLVYGSDWKAEFEFLLHCFEQHALCMVSRVFEPACGTGRLLFRLAKKGYQVSGLDLSKSAVAFCNRRLARSGTSEQVFVGNMCDFQLDHEVEAAFNMINSFRHLDSEQAARDHLRCVAATLASGGIYVLGLHLSPAEGTTTDGESWSARRGHLCVNSSLHCIDRDLEQRVERYRMTYDVYTPTRNFQLVDEVAFRTYTAAQMAELIASVKDFAVVETYDFSYGVDQPIEIDERTEDVVYVLRKK